MQFEYLMLADAANNGPGGKVNVLGMGARILTYPALPSAAPLTLIGLVSASTDEAGDYDVEIGLTEPDGTREVLVKTRGSVQSKVDDPRVPTGISFVLSFLRPFRVEGVHSFQARVGDLSKQYDFLVRIGGGEPQTEGPAS